MYGASTPTTAASLNNNIVQTVQLGYLGGHLENLNHDLAESLNLYATPRTHPPVRGKTYKSAKLPKLHTFESRVNLGLFVVGVHVLLQYIAKLCHTMY